MIESLVQQCGEEVLSETDIRLPIEDQPFFILVSPALDGFDLQTFYKRLPAGTHEDQRRTSYDPEAWKYFVFSVSPFIVNLESTLANHLCKTIAQARREQRSNIFAFRLSKHLEVLEKPPELF